MKRHLFLFILCLPLLSFSQERQFKVGLVLSGGGAKGFAYVGILKELEKAGVRIDYIGGTSMGAIIGGIYASGYSPEQIEKLIVEKDFYSLLQDKIPREAKSFFDKKNSEKYALSFPIKNNTIGLPKGVSKGQNTLNFLTYLLSPVSDITDFSKLPIPFYCISTDVETGNQVILEKGSLPLSLRASGSIPTLLYPVEIDGKMLIDGGVANNFPVEEMKKKDVDFIIGVDTQGKLAKNKNLTSVTKIISQIISYQIYNNLDKKKKELNIYIHPDLYKYNSISFDKKKEILKVGEQIAKEFRPLFDSLAKLQTYKRHRIKITPKTTKFLVNKIDVFGNKDYTKSYILGALRLKKGDSLTQKELSKRMNNLTATNNFDQIYCHLKKSFTGNKLIIKVKENATKTYLRLGLHYDLLYKSAVLLNYYNKKLLLKNDLFSLDLIIGDNLRYNLDYFVDNGFLWSYGLKSNYNNFKTNILSNQPTKNSIGISYRYFSNTLYTQTTFNRKFAFGLGIVHKNISIFSKTQKNSYKDVTFFDRSNYLNALFYLKLDTFDRDYFATKGVYADINLRWYMWSDRNENRYKFDLNTEPFNSYFQVQAKLDFVTTFWKKLTLGYTSEIGFIIGTDPSDVFNFRLGGYNQNYISTFVPFYGYEMAALDDHSFLKSTFHFRYQFLKKQYLSFIANYAIPDNDILKNLNLVENIKSGYAIGYSLDSFLGPIELKYSYSPDNNTNFWFFNLGFWF